MQLAHLAVSLGQQLGMLFWGKKFLDSSLCDKGFFCDSCKRHSCDVGAVVAACVYFCSIYA